VGIGCGGWSCREVQSYDLSYCMDRILVSTGQKRTIIGFDGCSDPDQAARRKSETKRQAM